MFHFYHFNIDFSVPLSRFSSLRPGELVKEATVINNLFVLAAQTGPICYANLRRFCVQFGISCLTESYYYSVAQPERPLVNEVSEEVGIILTIILVRLALLGIFCVAAFY